MERTIAMDFPMTHRLLIYHPDSELYKKILAVIDVWLEVAFGIQRT